MGAQADRDFEIVFTSVEGDRFQGGINGLDQMTFNPPESADGFAPPPTVAFDVTLNLERPMERPGELSVRTAPRSSHICEWVGPTHVR
ncbi:MAG: hypothetical protein AAFV53_23935 [Myxococcota bacterium]